MFWNWLWTSLHLIPKRCLPLSSSTPWVKENLVEILKSISSVTVRWFSDLKCYNDSLTINIKVWMEGDSAWCECAAGIISAIFHFHSRQQTRASHSWHIKKFSFYFDHLEKLQRHKKNRANIMNIRTHPFWIFMNI